MLPFWQAWQYFFPHWEHFRQFPETWWEVTPQEEHTVLIPETVGIQYSRCDLLPWQEGQYHLS